VKGNPWNTPAFGRFSLWAHDDFKPHLPGVEPGTSEWFWSWAAITTAHFTNRYPDDTIIYLDSDCWFMGDPMPAIQEVIDQEADIGSMTHRFPAHRPNQERGGWWVGFNVFLPNERSRACAAWWASMVRSRCDRHDPGDEWLGIPAGLAGDQPYLHAFHRLADHIEIQTPGMLASWNWDGYHLSWNWSLKAEAAGEKRRIVYAQTEPAAEHPDVDIVWLVHFHEYRFDAEGNKIKDTNYPVPDKVQEFVVAPYAEAVAAAAQELDA